MSDCKIFRLAQAIYSIRTLAYPSKVMNYSAYVRKPEGDDRYAVIPDMGRAGIFDSSNNPLASAIAEMLFKGFSQAEIPLPLEGILPAIQNGILRKWPGGGPQTTATIIELPLEPGRPGICAYTGDSPLVVTNRESKRMHIITDAPHRFPNGNTDSSKFLGSIGFRMITKPLWLPRFATLALMTDGINTPDVREILLSDADPDIKAHALVDTSTGGGDAVAVVIEIERPS